MTDVASLELCRELDELTHYKWQHDTQYRWLCLPKLIHKGSSPEQDFSSWQVKHLSFRGRYRVDWYAAYTLGYLLRKLPHMVEQDGNKFYRSLGVTPDGKVHIADYANSSVSKIYAYIERADTPENAACKLAIELIKQGVLKI